MIVNTEVEQTSDDRDAAARRVSAMTEYCATLPRPVVASPPMIRREALTNGTLTARSPATIVALLVAVAVAAVALLPAGASASAGRSKPDPFGTVTIRRTAFGVPHILARSYAGAGYGYGFAFAQDNLCTMAEDYVTVAGQRSRFFGPNGTYEQRGNGTTVNNLDSDFYWRQIDASGIIDRLVATRPPLGPGPEVRSLLNGYVAGYNRYLRSVGGSRGVPDPRCRGRAWVRPITAEDAYRRIYQLLEIASGNVVIEGIAQAKPPAATAASAAGATRLDANGLVSAVRRYRAASTDGSNAVAVGRAGTRDRRHGLLLGNPHFPWIGTERFYQAQLTIPGRLDVEGVSLYGSPLILIGHTRTMAWSHTVSTAFRFTPYELKLASGNPTSYMVDGRAVPMTKRTISVVVRGPNGALSRVQRTLYSTRWGPMITGLMGFNLPWSSTTAFAFADANAQNFRFVNHFFATNRARSVPEELRILRRYEGLPWVNTIAADRDGRTLYADIGTVPNVSNAMAARCNTAIGSVAFSQLGLPILDGSRSSCAWPNDRRAAAPGIMPPHKLPYLLRSDYVTNSNDSYWLANPAHPLEGFARIIGSERSARSLRTRIGLIMTKARIDGTDGLGPAGFTRADMQRMVFSNRQYAGELMRPALVALCRSLPGGQAPTTSGATVAVGDACDVLARWDLRENLGSRGAVLFRRFLDHAFQSSGSVFSTPFSVTDPVNTPNTLNTGNPDVAKSLGDAIADLRSAGLPMGVTVGQVQYVTRAGRRIPIHGGVGDPNGQFNAIWTDFNNKRFTEPVGGSSYVQVVTWNRGPCPDAATILTYSQSENPRSPHHSDQTRLFSAKRWVPERFCQADVRRHTISMTVLRP